MKIALVCPASLPATQFGGIVFLPIDLAREFSELGHDVTIYKTDLDFANGPTKFNKALPRLEKFEKFKINRTHAWFSVKLYFVNPAIYKLIIRVQIVNNIVFRLFYIFYKYVFWRKGEKIF